MLVHLLLLEIGAAHALVRVDLAAGGQRDPGYLQLNPGGVVPTLKLFTREAVNQARATMRSDSGMPTKVAVLGVIGLLLLSTHAEVLRLSAGRPPFRA